MNKRNYNLFLMVLYILCLICANPSFADGCNSVKSADLINCLDERVRKAQVNMDKYFVNLILTNESFLISKIKTFQKNSFDNIQQNCRQKFNEISPGREAAIEQLVCLIDQYKLLSKRVSKKYYLTAPTKVFNAPMVSDNALSNLSKGSLVGLLEAKSVDGNLWGKIKTDAASIGWVLFESLRLLNIPTQKQTVLQVRNAILVSKSYLYSDPNDVSKQNMYLVRGDHVEVLRNKADQNGQLWYEIRYERAEQAAIVKWILAETAAPLFTEQAFDQNEFYIIRKKAHLYEKPTEAAITNKYLIAEDLVEIVNEEMDSDKNLWLQVLYSKEGQTDIVYWLHASVVGER